MTRPEAREGIGRSRVLHRDGGKFESGGSLSLLAVVFDPVVDTLQQKRISVCSA